jgi:UPF0755 protein
VKGRVQKSGDTPPKQSTLLKRFAFLIILLAVPIAVGFSAVSPLRHFFLDPINPGSEEHIQFEVAERMSFPTIVKDLEKKKLIRSQWAFSLLGRIKGRDKLIQAGEYNLSPRMSAPEILRMLSSGERIVRTVTLREGYSIRELSRVFDEAGILPAAQIDATLNDNEFRKFLGIEAPSFEGYLFPETYSFSRPLDPKKAIATLVKQGLRLWTSEFSLRAQDLKLTRHEVLTLASIIEKESGSTEEQPLISSVFHNRLKNNMRLQSDPTVIYGIQNFNGNITRADLETSTPYNTYRITGLPPTPIANPGSTAIRAALFPADTTYLYFVANGKGSHVFSSNLADHNQAVNQYQRSKGVDIQ